MEEKDMSAVSDGMKDAGQETVGEAEDPIDREAATAPANGAENTADTTAESGEPLAPTAEVGITAADTPLFGEGGVPSAANEITNEPLDWTELCTAYPDVCADRMERDAAVCAMARGEVRPTPRQAYEITHMEAIVEARVAARVAEAVRESEARLLDHIRTCGQRPTENGVRAAVGVRMHPAVGRLTRSDRAALAKRAERGETIQL